MNEKRILLDWLNLEYFVCIFFSEYENIEDHNFLLKDIRKSAKNALMSHENSTVFKHFNDDCNRGWVNVRNCDAQKYETHHISFVVDSYFDNDPKNIRQIIRFLETFHTLAYKSKGFIDLYDKIKSSGHPNNTFMLIPALKSLTLKDNPAVKEFFQNLPNNTIMQKILSKKYFLLKNMHNKQYLHIEHYKNKNSSNFLRTVTISNSSPEYINWKFLHYRNYDTDPNLLEMTNESNGRSRYTLRPYYCILDDYSVLLMGNNHDKSIINYAWNLEIDDFFSERFRIRNAYTDEYLAVGTEDNHHEPSTVILVSEINTETYNSLHWTLEPAIDN